MSITAEQIATKIIDKRLQFPILIFLQMHLPMSSLAENLGLLIQPMLVPFFGFEKINSLINFLSDKNNVKKLIALLEENN
ncbi:MAG: hypothetical protein KBC84_02885 [Proteobacteria bacterium]|nr:hypothetical protein [Pseudomonadota bacterium]